ncbi:MAG: phospholipase D family protein [Steroidobacteraceae bacterium]
MGCSHRIQMIDAAQRSLDLQYFIFRGDTTGQLILAALTRAAGRGVAIRLLVDDGDTTDGDEKVLALRTVPGVEVRVFNPFRYRGHIRLVRAIEFAATLARLDYRMHNKLLVADNSLALSGGRNIANEVGFQVDPQAQSADDDVFVTGPVVHALSGTFDEYWNSKFCDSGRGADAPNRMRTPMPCDGGDPLRSTASTIPPALPAASRSQACWTVNSNWSGPPARVLCDSPDKRRADAGESGQIMARDVLASARQVQTEFLMINPYIIPTRGESTMLQDLRQRHVKVGIVTNSLQSTRDILAYAGYKRSRKPLLREGIDLYEVRAQLGNTRGSGQTPRVSRTGHYGLHGKLMVFDRKKYFHRSMNFDERSRHLNTEIGLIIDSPELADLTAARFNAMALPENAYHPSLVAVSGGTAGRLQWTTQEKGARVTYDKEPSPSPWRRLITSILAWLPVRREL